MGDERAGCAPSIQNDLARCEGPASAHQIHAHELRWTSESSPSGNVHGMPLGALCGRKGLGMSKVQVVDVANEYACGHGLERPPALLARVVGKMGLAPLHPGAPDQGGLHAPSPPTGPPQPNPSTVRGQIQKVLQKVHIAAARQQAARTSESDDGDFEMSVLLAL